MRECAREACKAQFEPRRRWQIYCSKHCNRLSYYERALTGTPPPTKSTSPPLGLWESELPPNQPTKSQRDEAVIEKAMQILGDTKFKISTLQDLGYSDKTDEPRPAYFKKPTEEDKP